MSDTRKRNMTLIHLAVMLVIMFLIGSITPPAPITSLGMKVLGIFVGLIYGWSAVGLIIPSLLGIAMLAAATEVSINQIFAEGFGSNIVVLLIFILVFVAAINDADIGKVIATWLLTRKFTIGRPWITSTTFFLAAFLVSAGVNSFGAIIICWGILYNICGSVGYKKGDAWPTFMVFGITISAVLGSGSFAFKAVPMVIIGVYESLTKASVNFLSYSIFFWVLSFIIMAAILLMGRFVFRIDTSLLKNVTEDMFNKSVLKLSKFQKVTFIFFLIMIVLLMIPSILPKNWALAIILNKWGATGIVIVVVMAMMCIQVEGKPLINFAKHAREGILWDPIVLTAVALPLSSALMAEEAGISGWLKVALGPILNGQTELMFLFCAFGLALLLTNFSNNGMVGIIFMPIILSFCGTFGLNPGAMAVMLIFAVHIALITPASCPMSGLMFSNPEWIKPKDIYKFGFPTLIIALLVVVLIGNPLGSVLF